MMTKQLEQYLADSNMFDIHIASKIIDILEKEEILKLETGVQMINSSEKDAWAKVKFKDVSNGNGRAAKIKREDTVMKEIIKFKKLKRSKSHSDLKARMRRLGPSIIDKFYRIQDVFMRFLARLSSFRG